MREWEEGFVRREVMGSRGKWLRGRKGGEERKKGEKVK